MDEKVNIKVLFFGKARELVKVSSSEVVLPINLPKDKIVFHLESKFPELCQLRGCYVLALNEEYLETVGNINLCPGTYFYFLCI
jgi:molybdopterin converting factor small subunit